MAWQDRRYYRDRSASPVNPLLWLLTGSVPLFTVFNIRVRMHASMILFIGLELLLAPTSFGMGPHNAFTAMIILFGSVLLHEFGHCFGARYMGGDADEILLWPLGGLATANPPRRAWPSLVTTACGPLVNLLICVLTGSAIALINHSIYDIPWIPPFNHLREYVPLDTATFYLWWVFVVNYALFTFNVLMVFYPFDGGRMIQELLWFRVGYYRSMLFATVVGMVGAVLVGGFGVATRSLFLLLLAVFGFMACYRQRQMLRETGPEEDWSESTDFSAAYEPHHSTSRRRRKVSRRAIKKAQRKAQQVADEQAFVDNILAKVSAHGMTSLTWGERRALRKATERQRRRDLEYLRAKL